MEGRIEREELGGRMEREGGVWMEKKIHNEWICRKKILVVEWIKFESQEKWIPFTKNDWKLWKSKLSGIKSLDVDKYINEGFFSIKMIFQAAGTNDDGKTAEEWTAPVKEVEYHICIERFKDGSQLIPHDAEMAGQI